MNSTLISKIHDPSELPHESVSALSYPNKSHMEVQVIILIYDTVQHSSQSVQLVLVILWLFNSISLTKSVHLISQVGNVWIEKLIFPRKSWFRIINLYMVLVRKFVGADEVCEGKMTWVCSFYTPSPLRIYVLPPQIFSSGDLVGCLSAHLPPSFPVGWE